MAASRKTRVWHKKSKDARKNLKMWADGGREEILKPHVEAYADALSRGARAQRDYHTRVCTEYHARISWRLKDHEEPEMPLPPYDPNATQTEERLTAEEEDERHNRVEELNKRIHRWLKYRARKLNRSFVAKTNDSKSPFAALMTKLTGVQSPPKARQALQQYQHEKADELRPLIDAAWKEEHALGADGVLQSKGPNAPFRSQVARKYFMALPEEERKAYGERAKQEAAKKKEEFNKAKLQGPSKSPEARQNCIDNLGSFLTSIMKGVSEYTGLQVCVLMGGPIPKYNGELGVIHLSVGKNLGRVPVAFPVWAKERFSHDVVGLMKEYLATAYTREQCDEARLSQGTSTSAAPGKMADNGGDSDSDTGSDDSDSDSDSDSDDDDDEEEVVKAPPKRKRASKENKENDGAERPEKKKKVTASPEELVCAEMEKGTGTVAGNLQPPPGLSAEQRHAWSIRRNAEIMKQIGLKHAASDLRKEMQPESSKKSTPKPRATKQPTATGPARRSTRTLGGGLRQLLADDPPLPHRRGSGGVDMPPVEDLDEMNDEELAEMLDDPMADQAEEVNDTSTLQTPTQSAVEQSPATVLEQTSVPVVAKPSVPVLEKPPMPALEKPSLENAITEDATTIPPPPATPTVSTPPHATTVACPEGAPDWFRQGLLHVSGVDLGHQYTELLRAFVTFEKGHGFEKDVEKGPKLPAKPRPAQVGEWIKVARRGPPRPIPDVKAFETEWWAWWSAMQPIWWKDGGEAVGRKRDEWGVLTAHGINGMLSVVATLYWWGCAGLEEGGTVPAEWGAAVSDVQSVFHGLQTSAI